MVSRARQWEIVVGVLLLLFVGLFLSFKAQAGTSSAPMRNAPQMVTDDVLRNADSYSADWLMWSKNYRGHRFSPLNQINRQNVKQLVPKWCFSLGTHGAQQCTPIVHNGVMYVTSAQGKIFAVDAETGEMKWEFDSKLPDDATKYGPDANRGAAIYRDRIYWNNIICTLFCLDAKTGEVIWKVTPEYYRLGYSKTFAPLIVKGMVVTGIGGGEYGIRGYVEARDANTGKLKWKTYTIPAPGEPGHETWPKDSDIWQHGGAPTWITGSFDPDLNTIYWTTGNAGPWHGGDRPGDNLYTCSLLALDADTGKIKWHFQFVQHDDWDYDSNVTPVLTELDGTPVVAMANKTGFLFVLDRRNGKFLKGVKVSETTKDFWAKGLDAQGHPIVEEWARPKVGSKERVFVAPSALGTCNWWGAAFDPRRNWMILVANETGNNLVWDPIPYVAGQEFIGTTEKEPFAEATRRTAERPGRVCAYDLKTMKKVWEAQPELEVRWGGPLVTGGDLVFSGTMRGYLQAFDAENGKTLWQFQTGSGIMAHPITYAVDGKQYVAIVSGKGGVANPASLSLDFFKYMKNHNSSGMVFAFRLP